MMARPGSADGSKELEMMRKLRTVLRQSSRGLGFAASFVGVFSSSKDAREKGSVTRILLGTPAEQAFSARYGAAETVGGTRNQRNLLRRH